MFIKLLNNLQAFTMITINDKKCAINKSSQKNQTDEKTIQHCLKQQQQQSQVFPLISLKPQHQMKSQQQQFLSKYSYNKDKPLHTTSNYFFYQATIKQSNTPVTLKTMKYPHVQLGPYLQKLKQTKSQNVIKIYDLLIQQQFMAIVTQPILYGNFKKALQKCKYLDEPDAIFVAKQILNGHVDLLRGDTNWFGTEEDIEFAQDGCVKLSWNNGCSFNLVNPIPAILAKISTRTSEQGLNPVLPFPVSKTLQELLRISKENASQIAMNPQMKKKQKLLKKKGKNWVALKEYKNKNQYFDQISYLAVHSQLGFIRVKTYDQGKISPNLLQLNKTKPSFTKLHDLYDQNNKTILLSDYSNDGTIQSYISRLKTAGIKLKEQQVQFLVYSLIDPIKMVQQSSVKAVCMLHVKNVFIEFGIPKIGEPVPMNEKIYEVMQDRKEVPDFYHQDFKADPNLREERFDTYSLGVLMYRMMYNDTLIFKQPGVVQMPAAPSYNKRLKQSVQLLIGHNSSLRQIQAKFQMSQQVKKVIQQHKQRSRIKKQADPNKGSQKTQQQQKGLQSEQQNDNQQQQKQQSSQDQQGNPKYQQEEDDDQGPGCCDYLRKKFQLKQPKKIDSEKRKAFVDQLQLSSFKNFRLWSKTVVIITLYIFLFYYQFIHNSIFLLASQGLLTKVDLTLQSKNLSIITTDRYQFQMVFNKTSRLISDLQNMNCLIEDSLMVDKYSDFIKEDSYVWYGYLYGALAGALLILVFKMVQVHTFDDINAWFRKQQGQGYFNLWNWVLVNFHWLSLISGHYFLFNFVYQPQVQPCVGHKKGYHWGSNDAFFDNHMKFIAPYVIVFGVQILVFLAYYILAIKNVQMTQKYNKIINTLTIFGSTLLVIWLMVRFGIILKDYYYPAALTDSGKSIIAEIKAKNYMLLFAILPEFLFIMEIILIAIINWVYYAFVDKTQRLLNNEASLDASLKDIV